MPAVLAGGGLAILAIWAFFTRRTYMGASEGPLLLIWSVAGLCGLLAWLWLSGVYLRRGRNGLRHAGALAWAGLGLGMLGALGVAGFIASPSSTAARGRCSVTWCSDRCCSFPVRTWCGSRGRRCAERMHRERFYGEGASMRDRWIECEGRATGAPGVIQAQAATEGRASST